MPGLTLDPGGHLQATITLTSGQSKQIKYFTPSCLFYKAFLSPQWFQLGPRTFFFFFLVIHLIEEISRKAVSVRRWGSWEKQSVMLSSLHCFVLFCYARPVFSSFLFFCLRIISCTAVCSEGSGLLAKTPQLTSDLCCENLTQMTTW